MKITPLQFLQAVYLNEELPLTTRMRAAMAAAPFEHPKLAVVATVNGGGDFADQLDRAVERSRRVMKDISPMIEAKPVIDANVSDNPTTSNGHKPSVVDRRYRRW